MTDRERAIAETWLQKIKREVAESKGGYWVTVCEKILSELDREREESHKDRVGLNQRIMQLEVENRKLREERGREPVAWFARRMEAKLRENDWKGGWENCTLQYLFEKLDEEIHELSACSTDVEVIEEAADVANIAMMIADNARKLIPGINSPHEEDTHDTN
jgi:hypothetical protein